MSNKKQTPAAPVVETSNVSETSNAPVAPANVDLFPKSSRKLSHAIALQILGRLRGGEKGSAIAKEFNVDSSTISDIKVGRLYKKALDEFKAMVAAEPVQELQQTS